jgi:hypothetical protein
MICSNDGTALATTKFVSRQSATTNPKCHWSLVLTPMDESEFPPTNSTQYPKDTPIDWRNKEAPQNTTKPH